MVFLLSVMLVLNALSLAATALTLSSVGSLHQTAANIQAQIIKAEHSVNIQSRSNRKWFSTVIDKYATLAGFVPPAPTMLEAAYIAMQKGEEPVLDFTRIGGRR